MSRPPLNYTTTIGVTQTVGECTNLQVESGSLYDLVQQRALAALEAGS